MSDGHAVASTVASCRPWLSSFPLGNLLPRMQRFVRIPDARLETSDAFKRSRVITSPAAQPVKYERIAGVPFPARIRALPHVLEHIDTLLMDPDEAARFAVTTGQTEWLRQIILRCGNNVASADMLVVAASKGHEDVVKYLLPVLSAAARQAWKLILPAMVAAGEGGQLGVLKVLLEELKIGSISAYYDREAAQREIEHTLCEAAGRGRLDVVTLLVRHFTEIRYSSVLGKMALSRAAAGGHTDVVEFLLQVCRSNWDFPHALATAIAMDQRAIAMQIYDGHPVYMRKNLFVAMASEGNTAAVEFLYPKVSGNAELLNAALLAAAEKDKSEVAVSLIATKRISSDTIAQSFVVAARHETGIIVRYLLANHELSSETLCAAFVHAAQHDQCGLVQTLYEGHQVSAEVVLQAFNTKFWSSNTKTLKYLVGLLSDETRVPREIKYKAFVSAATKGNMEPLQLLSKRGKAELPLEVLRDAHEATRNVNVKKLIYKVTYQQLFDPKIKGRFDAVAKLMAEWTQEPTEKKSRAPRKVK